MTRIVEEQDTVVIHYTARAPDGRVHDSSRGREPLTFTVGAGRVLPAVERAVVGLGVGGSRTVHVTADEAYGPRRRELVAELPRARLPADLAPQAGERLELKGADGEVAVARVVDVRADAVVVDANHPLAGEDVVFEIEVVSVA